MKASLIRFWRRNSGATAIEYAMIAGGIAVAIAATITQLGATVVGMWTNLLAAMQ